MFKTPPPKSPTAANQERMLTAGPSHLAVKKPAPAKMVEPLKPRTMESIAPVQSTDTTTTSVETLRGTPTKANHKMKDRLAEAKQCLIRAKTCLGNSRNIKTEIKTEVTIAVERLYQLVKEGESVKGRTQSKDSYSEKEPEKEKEVQKENKLERERKTGKEERELIDKMEEHARLIQENNNKMEKLKETIEKHQEFQERQSYASVAATFPRRQSQEQTALHSVVVTAKDDQETGEDVLNRIRKAVNAKEGGIVVENIRKAKDRKVIVGCRTEEEREKIKERLKQEEKHLNVDEVKNKDPLVILRDVFAYNSDDDVLKALRKQNISVFEGIDGKEKMEIAFRKRTRNPHTQHIVLRVSPKIWQHLVQVETVKVDLQRVRVADQSPLVQCSLCLGYGHSRRFCKETVEKCSHCGGSHMKTECADWLSEVPPACCNCKQAKLDRVDHNAFSGDCVIRKRWETLARATVAYQC